jgi:ribonuclease HI
LQLRREQHAIRLHEKLLRLEPDYWRSPAPPPVKRNGQPPKVVNAHITFTETTDKLREKFCPELLTKERLPFDVPIPLILPDHSNQMAPETKIDGLDKKASHSKIELKAKALAHLDKHFPQGEWLRIYTDGSFDVNKKRAGYGVYCIFFEEATPMCTDSCHFDAEVAAIASAAKKIAETTIFPLQKEKFVILSDSVAAIQFVTKAANLHPTALLFKKSLSKIRQQNRELGLQWIPSHCDIHGNEKADFLAKSATKVPPPPADILSFNSVKKKIKSALKKIFKKEKETNAGGKSWWGEIKKGPDKTWSRKTATAQFRLATGHDVLQNHLNRCKITKDPANCKLCNSGEVQDRAHLFKCAALKSEVDSLPDNLSRQEEEAIIYWIARKKNG